MKNKSTILKLICLMLTLIMLLGMLTACPGSQKPSGDTNPPSDDTPGDDTPGDDTPGDDTPGDDTPGDDTPGDDTPGDDTPGDDTPGDDTPSDDTPGDDTPGDDTPETPIESGPFAEGTLWYYEDFESYELSNDSATTAEQLGWSYDKTGGSNSADYHIADKDGSRQLYIYNNKSNGKDSFITFLTSDQFNYLHAHNFTYQYDLLYADSAEASRYITLISDFNGSDYYSSGHIRNGGYGNHEVYVHGSWKQYGTSITDKGANSIAKKLLGKSATHNVLKDISISVRYSVNWESGNNIYIRVNTPGYPGSDVWTLVGAYNPSGNGSQYLEHMIGSTAMAIKTGSKQNGYIDNIMIWAGNSEAPSSKDGALLNSSSTCHVMCEIEGENICVICGGDGSRDPNSTWLLDDIPEYDGGDHSKQIYLSGQALDPDQPREKETQTQVISNTTAAEFEAYIAKLSAEGYTLEYSNDADGNLFRSYIKGTKRVYTYFMNEIKEVRVILEDATECLSIADFGYTYTPAANESSEIYQYALPMRDGSHFSSQGYVDRGMLYVIKLADDSIILIDSGESTQFTNAQLDNLMSFLREITDVGEDGKVKIAAWYNTHAHGDHAQGFFQLVKRHHESIELERVIFNNPSTYLPNSTVQSVVGGYLYIVSYLDQYYPDAKYLKPHTGMKIQLADVTIDILYTHEDLIDPKSGMTRLGSNYNEASLVSKITFGGDKTFMVTGDIDSLAAATILTNWKAETLRVDVLQMAHHVLNDISEFYHTVQAPILFIPQSLHRIKEHSVAPKPHNAAIQYATEDNRYYQNEFTVGLGVVDGELTQIYSRDVLYEVNRNVGDGW